MKPSSLNSLSRLWGEGGPLGPGEGHGGFINRKSSAASAIRNSR